MNANIRKYFITGVSVIALSFILVLVIVLNRKPLDITGKYILKYDNKYLQTYLTVTSHGDEFLFNMENNDGLKATYSSKKLVSNSYTLTDFSGDNKMGVYKLDAMPEGLSGTIDQLPLGEVQIYFEKIKSGNEDANKMKQ
jgi:hypothetical protein